MPLSYQWLQRTGPAVSLVGGDTAYPSILIPAGASPSDTWTFQLSVSDGAFTSASDSVVVYGGTPARNVAPQASPTASSQNTATSSRARQAIDRKIDGYPWDSTLEWATTGQREGAWIRLTWSQPMRINSVRLHDRPNLNDWVTGGTLSFSNGSSVPVGALDNDGRAGTTLSFAPVCDKPDLYSDGRWLGDN